MANSKGKLTIDDVPMLLEALTCGDTTVQQKTLGILCPCRNRVYDREIWREIFRLYDEASVMVLVRNQAHYEQVRERAAHAIQTLHEFARTEPEAQAVLDALKAEGVDTPLATKCSPKAEASHRLARQALESIQETLACGEAEDQKALLTALCPCRNRRYDRDVWLAIFQAYAQAEAPMVRDQAYHAIDTLLQRARTDPRSQELLRRLATEESITIPVADAIPTWQPNLRGNGLYIPRFEHSPRSKSNRRR